MKSNDPRHIHVALWDLPNGETVRVTVRYPTMAGTERAYTLHVQPLTFERGDGYTVERYSPHRGYRMRLEAAARYSRKRLEALAEDPAVRDLARGMFDRCAADVGGVA
jgi:hypothetical protein